MSVMVNAVSKAASCILRRLECFDWIPDFVPRSEKRCSPLCPNDLITEGV